MCLYSEKRGYRRIHCPSDICCKTDMIVNHGEFNDMNISDVLN